jgi:protein-S-isoprenylcysteine O-methyltransferase Ste14
MHMDACQSRLFRDRRSAFSAALSAALLISMEVADVRRPTEAGDTVDDRGTGPWFGAAMAAAVAASAVAISQPARRPMPRHRGRWKWGIALIWLGAAINRSARRELGSNYRARLTVVDGQEVVDAGPYRLVRHPMYSGSIVICIGCGLAVDAPASLVWVLPAAALVHRVHVEEELLRSSLTREYDRFLEGRARLIPGVW